MTQSRRPGPSIKSELNNAVIGGIRLRGRDAVGLVLIGVAGLVVIVFALGVLLSFAALFGVEATATVCAGLGGLAAGVSRLLENHRTGAR